MECICPHCGKMIGNGKLSFNLNKAVFAKIEEIIKVLRSNNQKECGELQESCKKCYRICEEKQFFLLEPEDEIAKLSQNDSDGRLKCKYRVPFAKLIKFITVIKSDSNISGTFFKFIKDNEQIISDAIIYFELRKRMDGDVIFDSIHDTQGNKITQQRFCPHCGKEMSFYAGRYPEISLTVLGDARASKSTAVTACASSFMQGDNYIKWEGWKEDEGYRYFKEKYLDPYQEGKSVEATDTREVSVPRVSFRVTVGSQYFCLTFVDFPGEFSNMGREEMYHTYNDYFHNVDFVWYCTDPGEILQIGGDAGTSEKIRNLGYDKERKVKDEQEIKVFIANIAGCFNRRPRKVPVAYILGKTDAFCIDNEDRKEYELYLPEEDLKPTASFPVSQFYNRSFKARKYIQDNNWGLLNNFEENFADRCYIATSAYGYNPNSEIKSEMKPYQCRLPFLWMMALCSYIDVKLTVREKGQGLFSGRFGKNRDRIYEVEDRFCNLTQEQQMTVLHNLYMHGDAYHI